MKKIFLILASLGAAGTLFGQSPTPAPNDIESLRQQVQALTTTVKTLQQQVKDQQDALAKINAGGAPPLPTNPSPTPAASPTASSPPLFPTTDEAVVASAPEPSPLPANATGPAAAPVNQQFPTSDTSVVASSPTISSSGAGASLVAPMAIAGSRASGTYMNLSFDGQFALAYSSDKNLNQLEVGDHDPQQRGFNARNLKLALDGAVDPYFEGFANIVLIR